MKRMMTGARVVETLLAMQEGDVMWVGTTEWTALGGYFEKVTDHGQGNREVIHNDDLPAEFESARVFEVSR